MPDDAGAATNGFDVWWAEARKMLHVSLPSVAVQFNLYFVFPQAASLVGRILSTDQLAGFSLGVMTGSLTTLSLVVGALAAADTLMPRAYGAQHYDELGRLAIRAFAVCGMLLVAPIAVLSQSSFVESTLIALRQDPLAAHQAAVWIRIFLLGTPANMMFRVIQRFLVAQHQPWPPVYASILPTFVFCPLLLSVLVPRMGVVGSAWSIAATQWLMLTLLLVHLRLWPVYHPDSWPGLSVQYVTEALRLKPTRRFIHLGLGGVMSLSEWWFWETMCFVAGSFGIVPLCAHTIAYNLIPLLFMIPLGTSIGLSVRMGHVIAHDAGTARLVAAWTLALIAVLGASLGVVLYLFRLSVIQMFTNDTNVIEESLRIWPKVCYYVFVLYVFGINGAILRALGLQWRMASILVGCLWFLTLPSVLWFAVYRHGGLDTQWTIVCICYSIMQVCLIAGYMTIDWDTWSARIRLSVSRSFMESKRPRSTKSATASPTNTTTTATAVTPPAANEATPLLHQEGEEV